MPHLMLYGTRLRGYAPYAHGLWSGSTEWIILRMAHKRKLANRLSYSKHWISFHIIYYPLYILIMQLYHDSGSMRNSDRISQLRSHFLISADVTTSNISPLWFCITTPINEHAIYLTTSAVKDFAWSG
jgi:hypothetical protein